MDKRNYRNALAGILALVLIISLAVGFLPSRANAYSSSELKQQLNSLKQEKAGLESQISNLRNQISENSSEIERMVGEKNVIDQEIFLLHQQLLNINDQIATYNLLIADKQEELTVAEARFDKLLEENKSRIQAMEEEGDVSYWSVLFEANDFSDLLDRFNMIQEIAAADKRRLEELDKAAKEVNAAKASLEEEKVSLEASKEELAQTQEQLAQKREEADKLLAELVAKGMEFEEMMEESEAEQAQLAKDIANKKDEYDKAKYQEWLATSVPPTTKPKPPASGGGGGSTGSNTVGGTSWKVPIKYTAFTSPYGWRTHPISGTRKFHYGVDLAAPTGRPIYATRSGTVDTAAYGSSAGYYVQINHGDGYKSIYMHMTHYIVKRGQHVTQGQVIGYCGSTGGSTGPHLHFGISYRGSYVNPANYIRI